MISSRIYLMNCQPKYLSKYADSKRMSVFLQIRQIILCTALLVGVTWWYNLNYYIISGISFEYAPDVIPWVCYAVNETVIDLNTPGGLNSLLPRYSHFSSQSLQCKGIERLMCYWISLPFVLLDLKENRPHVILLSRQPPSHIQSNYKLANWGIYVSTFLWIIAWTKNICMPHPTLLANLILSFQQNKDDMCNRGYFRNQSLQ